MNHQNIFATTLSNMEMSPNKRKSMSVDVLSSADHTSLSVDDLQRKYRSVEPLGSADSVTGESSVNKEVNEDIEVRLIRNKDRAADASDPVGERTVIFNTGGDIIGAQG